MSDVKPVDHADMADANFPRSADGRSYHVGSRTGEVANRILIVGSASRAARIAKSFDKVCHTRASDRGFCVRTGLFKGVPVTVVSIGMGVAMCDFAVRELRDAVTGPMVCVRLGTCGVIRDDVEVGTVVVASKGSVFVRRDPDYFGMTDEEKTKAEPYIVSRPVAADADLSSAIAASLGGKLGAMEPKRAVVCGMNATACSFYSSQGRQDASFDDANADVVDNLAKSHPDVVSLEMESFHLLDMARVCRRGGIRAAAVAIALAQRKEGGFLDNASLYAIEEVAGEAILDVLAGTEIKGAAEHGVWEQEAEAEEQSGGDKKRAKAE